MLLRLTATHCGNLLTLAFRKKIIRKSYFLQAQMNGAPYATLMNGWPNLKERNLINVELGPLALLQAIR